MQVAVCGPAQATPAEEVYARRVGELLAGRGVTVLCGGGGGVMAAVAAGARARGGLVIGVRPDDGSAPGPAEVSAHLVTNMGQARNAILVWSADAVIAVGGSWGTLSEVALGMRRGGIPVVVLGGWRVVDAHGDPVPGPVPVDTPEEAVRLALGEPG
ncbi:LOG family protein [Micromonospora soli]|uniref:SLOG cluster 4 domain-containing protein n=1 Tax=Micromonospora sp. NBRC 110009 TaxID=3061627 RepID=UPI00267146B7|nr:LOG family protein [Micromonospora sp. NBRC 110009]WKT98283.1 LOG family protein [Micromonospora sp. NBRC 110009]